MAFLHVSGSGLFNYIKIPDSVLRLSRNIMQLLTNVFSSALVSALLSPFVHGKCLNGAESDSEYLISM